MSRPRSRRPTRPARAEVKSLWPSAGSFDFGDRMAAGVPMRTITRSQSIHSLMVGKAEAQQAAWLLGAFAFLRHAIDTFFGACGSQ